MQWPDTFRPVVGHHPGTEGHVTVIKSANHNVRVILRTLMFKMRLFKQH
jgi:hypothetical protein